RRGARRGNARAIRAETRVARAAARARGRGERGDVLPVVPRSRGRVVRGVRDAAPRARRRRRARLVLRSVRRRLCAPGARAVGRRVRAGGGDPAESAVNVEATIAALDRGDVRVAEQREGEWVVIEEAKSA